MSRIRKERKRKRQKKFFTLVGITVIVIVFFGIYLVYNQFIKKEKIESFFPEKPVFYVKLNLDPTLAQGKNLLKISEKFQDKEFFTKALTNFIFGEISEDQIEIKAQELTGFVGEEVILGNISLSQLENLPSMVVKVKNPEKANEFLKNLKSKLELKGNAVSESTFREEKITKVEGSNEISYAIVSSYLLISQKESGIKKMIDVSLGKENSLDDSKEYQKIVKKTKGKNEIVFCYFDLLELTGLFMNQLKIGEGDFFEKVGYGSTAPAGLVLVPKADGFKIKLFVSSENYNKDGDNFKETIVNEVPSDLVFYLEGRDLRPFLESLIVGKDANDNEANSRAEGIKRAIELEFGFNVDNDFLDLFKDQYSVVLFPGNEGGKPNLAFYFTQKDGKEAREKLLKLESTILNLLKKYKPDEFGQEREFTTHKFEEVEYRYLNLPDKYPFEVAYSTFDDKTVFALTGEAMKQATKKVSKNESLESDRLFKNNLENIEINKFRQLIYLEPQAAFKLIDETTEFDYGYLSEQTRLLESLGIKSYRTNDGLFLEGFLSLKD